MARAPRNGRTSAVVTATVPVRCAIYTRKSTDEGLDKEFNTLDAQREAAEAYVASQRGENWVALPARYDDGGFSGGTTERPGLKRLLADVEAGEVDCIVVYKYDRLSRSMLDFLQLLQSFKRHRVSFVSVSQRFDTSTPVGEMTLNILLSFAQFERQIIAERTRDKVGAARRRGKWTGGMPPLGYNVAREGGRLVVNRDEADQVRAIFEMYVENPKLVPIAQELNRRGWRRKSWTTKDGKPRQGMPWNRVTLRALLRDPVYVGQQKLLGETFKGEHPAIVSNDLWNRTQRIMKDNARTGGAGRNSSGALLGGLLQCGACDRAMTATWSHGKLNRRLYRYYTCTGAQKNGASSCPSRSISADRVETFVVNEIKRIGSDPALQRETFRQALLQVEAQQRGLRAEAKRLERDLAQTRREVERLVASLTRAAGAAADAITIELDKAQERVGLLETRRREGETQRVALAGLAVDEEDLTRALQAFDEVWEALLVPERERVLRLLLERVTYHGGTGQLSMSYRMNGLAELAAEIEEAAS